MRCFSLAGRAAWLLACGMPTAAKRGLFWFARSHLAPGVEGSGCCAPRAGYMLLPTLLTYGPGLGSSPRAIPKPSSSAPSPMFLSAPVTRSLSCCSQRSRGGFSTAALHTPILGREGGRSPGVKAVAGPSSCTRHFYSQVCLTRLGVRHGNRQDRSRVGLGLPPVRMAKHSLGVLRTKSDTVPPLYFFSKGGILAPLTFSPLLASPLHWALFAKGNKNHRTRSSEGKRTRLSVTKEGVKGD